MCTLDKELMILENQNLIYGVLKKYNRVHDEDLFQVGAIGLIKAVNSFDESRKVSFSSFAYTCINNEILIYFRKQKNKSFYHSANLVSYNAPMNEENGNGTFEDLISYEPDFDQRLVFEELYHNVNNLTPIEKELIISYYGLYDTTPIKQVALSQKFHMSQANVSRVIRRAMKKIRVAMEV